VLDLLLFGGRKRFLDGRADVAAAYSLRRVNSFYSGPVVRVRRSSDNLEADFGVGQSGADWGTIAGFIGSGSGFVSKWYDQSGNGRDVLQATAANQPQMSLLSNGRPGMPFNGTSQYLQSAAFTLVQPWSFNFIARTIAVPTTWAFSSYFSDRSSNNVAIARRGNGGTPTTETANMTVIDGGSFMNGGTTAFPIATRGAIGGVLNGTSSRIEINSAQIASTADGTNVGVAGMDGLTIGANGFTVPNTFGNVEFQELTLFNTAHSQGQLQSDNASMRTAWSF
jgi:hypothetical protein